MRLFDDMKENEFWVTVWTIICFFIVMSFTILGIVNWHEDDLQYKDATLKRQMKEKQDIRIAEMVKQGKDPLELSCLFVEQETTQCALLIQQRVLKNERNTSNSERLQN